MNLFAELTEGVFGRFGSKILDPIKLEINKIGEENIHQEEKQIPKKPMKILIADDDLDILGLYRAFLEAKGKEIILTTDGRKCIEMYKRENHSQLILKQLIILNYFLILDKMLKTFL